jgi:hypothetical protein
VVSHALHPTSETQTVLTAAACHDVLISNITRPKRVQFWPHDFVGTGQIRHRRPHRGRAAIADPDAEGDAKYHFDTVGKNQEKYYFCGGKNYKPIIYRSNQPLPPPIEATAASEASKKRKTEEAMSGESTSAPDYSRRGHNQFTPKEFLVKYGAPSHSEGRKRYRARINQFLRRSASPDFPVARNFRNEIMHFGGKEEMAEAERALLPPYGVVESVDGGAEELWMDDPDTVGGEEELVGDMEGEEEPAPMIRQERRKTPELSWMERMAAEEIPTTNATAGDTGSYAAQLEQELITANARIQTLEEENSALKTQLNGIRDVMEN